MFAFRLLLIIFAAVIVAFTITAVANEGFNVLPHFFGPILAGTWQGQFNVDFTTYLILSGVWIAWRGGLTGRSIAFGMLAPPLGILFLAPYLIYLVGKTNGDPRKLLLGVHA